MKSPIKGEKGSALILELIILAAVICLAGFAYYNYEQHKNEVSSSIKPVSHAAGKPNPSPAADSTAGWMTYKSSYEGMSFRYPSDWKLTVTTQQVTGWSNVDTVTLTSGSGFKITFFTHVQGLGGDCSSSDCPYVQTLSTEPMPHIPGTYLIKRELREANNKTVETREIGVKAITDPKNQYDVIPAVGTVQEFAYYLVFPSRGVDKTAASFVGSYPSGSPKYQLSTASYFSLPDVITGQQIIESATY